MKTLTRQHRPMPSSLFAAVGAFVARLAMECRIRRDAARLQAMSDRKLCDIGMRRKDIRDALRRGRDRRLRGN